MILCSSTANVKEFPYNKLGLGQECIFYFFRFPACFGSEFLNIKLEKRVLDQVQLKLLLYKSQSSVAPIFNKYSDRKSDLTSYFTKKPRFFFGFFGISFFKIFKVVFFFNFLHFIFWLKAQRVDKDVFCERYQKVISQKRKPLYIFNQNLSIFAFTGLFFTLLLQFYLNLT